MNLSSLQVDEARRRLNAKLHSAGHALDVAVTRAGLGKYLKPTKGIVETEVVFLFHIVYNEPLLENITIVKGELILYIFISARS